MSRNDSVLHRVQWVDQKMGGRGDYQSGDRVMFDCGLFLDHRNLYLIGLGIVHDKGLVKHLNVDWVLF